MTNIIQRLISSGADLSTKKTLKTALGVIGVSPENIDKIYVEIKNSLHKESFMKIPAEEKAVFLPQCMRNAGKCKAEMTDYGYVCKRCGACKIATVVKEAERRGYRVFVVPGGSMVFKVINDLKPKAVIGVACMKELTMALEELKIPSQTVELSRDGCVNTDVEVKHIIDKMDGNGADD